MLSMKKFRFEHEFRDTTPRDILEMYFEPTHEAEQDRIADIDSRELISEDDTPTVRTRVYKVFPRRQLPAAVRPFLQSGPLHYIEQVTWRKDQDILEFDIRPSVLGGRAHIVATYRLAPTGAGRVRRTYEGNVTVEVALVGGRIEKGIAEELEESLARTARCTQEWLDRGRDPGRERSAAHGS
jgi:hypothetical protein